MSHFKSARVVGAVIASVMMFSLAACSSESTPDDKSQQSSTGSQAPAENHTLRLSMSAPPSNLSVGNFSGGDSTMFMSIYDTLIHMDNEGNLVPGIAEKWEYNSERTELTLNIRSGLTFTNGEKLDAKAVMESLNTARTGPSSAGNLKSITDVSAPDETTVVITLAEPDASLEYTLTSFHGAIGAPSVLTAESSKLEPIGSGAYVLDLAKTTNGAKYVLERNEDFYDLAQYPFDSLEIQVIQDPTAVQNAVRAGQIDFAGLQTADQASQFPDDKFTVGTNKPNSVGVLWMIDGAGKVVPQLADERVRQAINFAFDREGIAQGLGPGIMHATEQLFSPLGGAWSDAENAVYPHDVTKAKQLLADAGYPDGFEVSMPSTVLTTAYEPFITQALKDIGITVNWDNVPFQDFYSKIYGGAYGMFFMFNGFGGSDAGDINAALNFNTLGYLDPKIVDLLEAANIAGTPDAFAPLNDYLVKSAWAAPLAYTTSMYVVPNTVTYDPPVRGNAGVLPFGLAN